MTSLAFAALTASNIVGWSAGTFIVAPIATGAAKTPNAVISIPPIHRILLFSRTVFVPLSCSGLFVILDDFIWFFQGLVQYLDE